MRTAGLRNRRHIGFPAVLLLLPLLVVVTTALLACGKGEVAVPATVTEEPTSVKRNLQGSTVEGRTPVAKAGTPDVQSFPSQIGDCVLEPNTDCQGADLRGAALGFRSFSFGAGIRIKLMGANFQDADFTGADLFNANFTSANLSGANFTNAKLAGANLFQADLRGANLTGADLSFADLEEAKLDGAIFCNTTMPDASVNNEDCP
jgi:uncharacterized protein YjbI with pentapeptide repeats